MRHSLPVSSLFKILTLTLIVLLLLGSLWISTLRVQALQTGATATLSPHQLTAVHLTVTAAMAASSSLYDDFQGTTLDTSKWTDASDFDCLIRQKNGMVSIDAANSINGLNCILEIGSQTIGFGELGWVEAEFMIQDGHNSHEINQGIEINTSSLPEFNYLFCGIDAASVPQGVFTGQVMMNGSLRQFGDPEKYVEIGYSEAHVFRLEVTSGSDPAAICFMDEKEIDSISLSNIENIREAEFVRALSSYRAENAVGTTHIDNVHLSSP